MKARHVLIAISILPISQPSNAWEKAGGNVYMPVDSNNHTQTSTSAAGAYSNGVGIGKGGDSTGASSTTNVNAGNSSYNVPRQTPFAYSPGMAMSFSQQNCTSSASVGISAPFGAIGGGVPITSEGCERRLDTLMWQQGGLPRVACNRMTLESGANMDALKASGMACNEIDKVSVAVPTNAVVPVATPALDKYDNELRDRNFREKMGK
jgi:hypothetical protein